jgi:hypothetical protein
MSMAFRYHQPDPPISLRRWVFYRPAFAQFSLKSFVPHGEGLGFFVKEKIVADIREMTGGHHVFGAGSGGFLSPEQKREVMIDPSVLTPKRVPVGIEKEVIDNLSRPSATCVVFGDGRCFISGHLGNLVFRPSDLSEETLALFMSRVG